MSTPLAAEIAALIRETGPIGLDRYMALCLNHPVHGYYRTRDPLGGRGDFTTAPEISQMFGELIGVWIAAVHAAMGAPARLRLTELGPGRGTLMADALRALARLLPGVALDLHLVETSPILRAAQAERLAAAAPTWHADPGSLPDEPLILVANEFFDCLPVRQFHCGPRGWHERVVGLSGDALAFGLAPDPASDLSTPDLPIPNRPGATQEGVLMTLPTVGLDLIRGLARRARTRGGAALIVDYGHAEPGFGDTLQALSRHRFADPLAAPGATDLTAHVDFAALSRAAAAEGAAVRGPASQRDFLLAMGIAARAARLARDASAAQVEALAAEAARLTDPASTGMGALFKVMAVADPGLGPLPGLP